MTDRGRNDLTIGPIRRRLGGYKAITISTEEAPLRAAVALIIKEGSGPRDLELLFIKRSLDPRDPWSGHMAFPGGRVSAGDSDGLAGAIRECWEEVGISLEEAASYLGRLDDVMAVAQGRVVGFAIEPYVFELHREVEIRTDSREVDHALWIPLSALTNPDARGTMPYLLEGNILELPCIPYEGRLIWGLSLHILFMFLAVVAGEAPPRRFGSAAVKS